MSKRTPSSKSKSAQKKTHKSAKSSEKKDKGTRKPTSYLIFCTEQRAQRVAEFKQLAPTDIMKLLGAEWRELSPKQKQDYKVKASAQKTPSDNVDSSSSKSQTNKKPEHSAAQQSSTKKKAEPSASRKAAHTHEDHHQSDASSVE